MDQSIDHIVYEYMQAERLIGPQERLVLAVSGGADSMALLYLFAGFRKQHRLENPMFCAHIDHHLRGQDSDRDRQFVVAQAHLLDFEVITRDVYVRDHAKNHKLSIETAARQLRLEALSQIATENQCSKIITAHHMDDNVETIVQRLVRGTGFRGLCGIRPMHRFDHGICYVRPLLCLRREQIEAYLNQQEIDFREDITNRDLRFRRNFIRHRLIPQYRCQCDEDPVILMNELAQAMRGFSGRIIAEARNHFKHLATVEKKAVHLRTEPFNRLHPELKIELLRMALRQLGVGLRDYTQRHFEKMIKAAGPQSPKRRIQLPQGVRAKQTDKQLILSCQTEQAEKKSDRTKTLQVPGETVFGNLVIQAELIDLEQSAGSVKNANSDDECFDADQIQLPLNVRYRRPGDAFRPLGVDGSRKIGKFLSDLKIPMSQRNKALIISDAEKIIWVCPYRISEQAKVTGHTKRLLRLTLRER